MLTNPARSTPPPPTVHLGTPRWRKYTDSPIRTRPSIPPPHPTPGGAPRRAQSPPSRGSRAIVSDSSFAIAVDTARVSAHEMRCAANVAHLRVDHVASSYSDGLQPLLADGGGPLEQLHQVGAEAAERLD